MNCRHNHIDPSTIKYGAKPARSWRCTACEAQAELKKNNEELTAKVAALEEAVKKLTTTISALNYKIEMQRPLVLR